MTETATVFALVRPESNRGFGGITTIENTSFPHINYTQVGYSLQPELNEDVSDNPVLSPQSHEFAVA
jgi:hypothetical protein